MNMYSYRHLHSTQVCDNTRMLATISMHTSCIYYCNAIHLHHFTHIKIYTRIAVVNNTSLGWKFLYNVITACWKFDHNHTVRSGCNGTLKLSNIGRIISFISANTLCKATFIVFNAPAVFIKNRGKKQVKQFANVNTALLFTPYATI